MNWQDVVIATMQVVLVLPALKMLAEGTRPSRLSCLLLAGPLTVIAGTMASLSLWLTTGTLMLNVVTWLVLASVKRPS